MHARDAHQSANRPDASHCSTRCSGSHIIRSRLTLSKPACRAARRRSRARVGGMQPAQAPQFLVIETTGRRS